MSRKKNKSSSIPNLFDVFGIETSEIKVKKKRKAHPNTEIRFSSEDDMEPHSEAKVKLYSNYLVKFLAILGVTSFVKKINIFDVFCGTGLYHNGKEGSPIEAYNAIKKTNIFLTSLKKERKPISLIVNDGKSESISTVSSYLSALNKEEKHCELEFHNLNSTEMFTSIINRIKNQGHREKNLIFIDPTGYKEIRKDDILKLLRNKQSEIVLFLPVSFMYRFRAAVQEDLKNQSYFHLRRFIFEFFEENHPLRNNQKTDIHGFIKSIKEALTFNNIFYCTSFFLKRGANNYYALFFITPNILGLEKVIETKWQMDVVYGEGFINKKEVSYQSNLFSIIEDAPSIASSKLKILENLIFNFIKDQSKISHNCNLYEYVLMNDFKLTHANQILLRWQNESLLEVWDIDKKILARKKSFYLTYELYKNKDIKVNFKLVAI